MSFAVPGFGASLDEPARSALRPSDQGSMKEDITDREELHCSRVGNRLSRLKRVTCCRSSTQRICPQAITDAKQTDAN